MSKHVFCRDCEYKGKCRQAGDPWGEQFFPRIRLCRLVREYADQDHKAQREELSGRVVVEELKAKRPLWDHNGLGDVEFNVVIQAGLTEKQKKALYLRYWEAMTLKEVGEALGGISHQNASRLIERARRGVKKFLNGERIFFDSEDK